MVLRSDSAVLLYLWGNDPRSLQWLRQQLDQALRARSRRALHSALVDEASFVAALAGVLAPAPGAQNFAAGVDLPTSPAAWPLADHWLARVNERRSLLLQWPRAVILAGPTALEARAGKVGPDLWSVRSGSFEVPAWAVDQIERTPATPSAMPQHAVTAEGPSVLPEVALWDEAVAAALVRKPGASARLNVALGFDAVDEARRHRQLTLAERILLQTGREVDVAPPDGDPSAVRRLYLQRTWQGMLAADRRQWALARECHTDAIALAQRLVVLTGESPEALRDLAIGLERLGDTHLALGNPALARQFFTRDLAAAEAALRQSPLSQDIQNVVATAQARLAALPTPPP